MTFQSVEPPLDRANNSSTCKLYRRPGIDLLSALQKLFGVHYGEGEFRWRRSQARKVTHGVAAAVKKYVLTIPAGDTPIGPDARAQNVEDLKIMTTEELGPEVLPLLVEVAGSSLHWNRSREQNDRSQLGEVFHK